MALRRVVDFALSSPLNLIAAAGYFAENRTHYKLECHLYGMGTCSSEDFITIFDAILTGRQSGQKLQCLFGNPMANNFFLKFNFIQFVSQNIKAGVHVKAVLTSLKTAFLPISWSHEAMLNLSPCFINHCLAVSCKFLGILEKRYFFSKDRLN